jgi:DNA gyrase/topoisomerase IV subunit A
LLAELSKPNLPGFKMAATVQATELFKKIHDLIQESGLHFVINQTPFSSYITIRKKLINPQIKVPENKAVAALKLKLEDLKQKVKTLEDEKGDLEELCAVKDEEASAHECEMETRLSNVHAFADRLSAEKEKCKKEISQLKQELGETHDKLSKSNRIVKTNEKEIHNLNKTLDNCHDTIKSLKSEKAILKSEKVKAETDLKNSVKKSIKLVRKKSVETQTDFSILEYSKVVTSISSNSSSLDSQQSSKTHQPLANVDEEGNELNEKNTCDNLISSDKPLDEPETDDAPIAVPNIKVENIFDILASDVTVAMPSILVPTSSLVTTSCMDTSSNLKTTTSLDITSDKASSSSFKASLDPPISKDDEKELCALIISCTKKLDDMFLKWK